MWSTLRERGLLNYFVAGPFAIALAFPFYWMLVTAFKTNGDLYNLDNVPFTYHNSDPALGEKLNFAGHNWLPFGFEHATTSHVSFIFDADNTKYVRWIENTAVVGGLVVLITLLLAVPAGYSLARLSGRWGQSVGVGIFLTYLVPPTLLFLPLSRVISKLGLQDQLWSLVLVYPSFTIPFATWLLMGFFKTIPLELEDAALIDGCSRLKALVRVIFPISIPGILTVIIFTFSLCVNEFVYAITFISSSTERTVSAGVPTDLIRGDVYFWQSLMAATLIPSVLLALLYNSFLNRFIAGFTGGAFR
jgi:multiple sugar transport system permease protein